MSDGKAPNLFLSIVTRTMGDRMLELADVFECLKVQDCQDFEFIVVGHKLTDEGKNQIENLISNQQEAFRNKTRLITVDHGGRTAPLNTGFASARGRYIAILDDDDVVYQNWVSVFAALEEESSGKVLHAFGDLQVWEKAVGADGEIIRRPKEPINKEYCVDFNMLDQLAGNRCPPFTLAFPARIFQECGIHFDESLSTYEDWDYLMQAAFICGCTNARVETGLYRIWKNTDNSLTSHSKAEWQENFEYVKRKMAGNSLTLSPEEVGELIERMAVYLDIERKTDDIKAHNEALLSEGASRLKNARLYIDTGKGYDEDNTLEGLLSIEQNTFRIEYANVGIFGAPVKYRWDPTENESLFIENIRIELIRTDGSQNWVDYKKLRTNGMKYARGIYCISKDPNISFPAGKVEAKKVIVSGDCHMNIPSEIITELRVR